MIDDVIISTIQGCAFALDASREYVEISEEELENIRAQIYNLVNELLESHIDKEFKQFLAKKLKDLDASIDKFIISGIEGVKSAVDESIGSMFLYKDLKDQMDNGKDLKLKELFVKSIKIFSDVNTLVDLGKNVAPLIELFTKKLVG
jgi:RecG-like helicase